MKLFLAASALALFLAPHALYAQSTPASERPIAGLGHAHMDTSCSPGVSADFDRALALLHNFWYARALEAFTEVAQRDPDCAIAYWGAAKTYDHPFWDPPTRADESAAWALVQKGMRATRKSPRETMYLAAVPHAQHMPSHIFTRLGYWAESTTTNENAWRTSEADVKRAGESGAYRDFHALNYLQYAYLQLGRFQDAKRVTGIIEAQYGALSNKTTAPDTPDLQARHVRGRTIYALPDRVVYGYFDMLTRFMVESGDWSAVATVPLVARSRDFRAMKLQLEAMAAAKRGDPATGKTAADELERLASEPGQHPLAQTIITLQTKEAQAVAAHAAGDEPRVIAMMTKAVEIEDSIEALSQPPYPIIPAHELYGTLLLELKRPAEAAQHFAEALKRTPGRPMAVYGIARAAEALGDTSTALARYTQFLELWKHADHDRPELAIARRLIAAGGRS